MSAEVVSLLGSVVGPDNVVTHAVELDRAATATFETHSRPIAVARPASTDEVVALVRLARERGLELHPVSGGKNWGLGSRVAPRDGSVLVDLSRMNRIADLDEELAVVSVEPGVTFQALADHLVAKGSRLFASTTGGSPAGSVLANALERGDGSGPLGERANHVCGMEVVLGSGEVVTTGFRRFGDGPLAGLHRYGVGPALDGLFFQSRYGIVTKLWLWLLPRARALGVVRFAMQRPSDLGPVVDAVRELKLEGTLTSGVGLWNDYRMVSAVDTTRPSSPEEARRLAGGSWFGLASVYAASEAQCDADVQRVRQLLEPRVERLEMERYDGRKLPEPGNPGLSFLYGMPHELSLKSAYCRKPAGAPNAGLDPDRDRCGVIWLCPALPLSAAHVTRAVALSERILAEHDFDPLLVLVAHAARTAHFLPMIAYDRDVAGDDQRAMACHDALLSALIAQGYLPERLGIQSFAALPPAVRDDARVRQRLASILDPDGVLSPAG